ncbi:MAG TPA: ABC transporter ATP-binding protein [Nitrospiria bacterium]
MSIIEFQEVTKFYSKSEGPAVENISLDIEKGEVLALLGPSGSGKTTILRLIAGFEIPEQGKVFLRGKEVSAPNHCLPPEKRGVGMVFQDYGLFPHLTVEKNIAFGLIRDSLSERSRKVKNILSLVGLTSLEHRYPHELSGGQQQRVALARALAPNPILVLLDEPFSNLDPDMRSRMREEVDQILTRMGMTAVLVTHDHEEAFAMADKVAVLNQGRLEQLGSPEEIYHTPYTPFVADFVGHADFLNGEVGADGMIHTEIGTFPNEKGFPIGTGLAVMIRPDDIQLVPDREGIAKVKSRQFHGSENLYTLSLLSGQTLHSSEHSITVYPSGTRVNLKLTATHTVLFDRTSISKLQNLIEKK